MSAPAFPPGTCNPAASAGAPLPARPDETPRHGWPRLAPAVAPSPPMAATAPPTGFPLVVIPRRSIRVEQLPPRVCVEDEGRAADRLAAQQLMEYMRDLCRPIPLERRLACRPCEGAGGWLCLYELEMEGDWMYGSLLVYFARPEVAVLRDRLEARRLAAQGSRSQRPPAPRQPQLHKELHKGSITASGRWRPSVAELVAHACTLPTAAWPTRTRDLLKSANLWMRHPGAPAASAPRAPDADTDTPTPLNVALWTAAPPEGCSHH
ncbi:hypothetical protein DB346_15555 [Verrucomicrobia bacterium LW23]|nr:hypothetical protein DB346_15555 [Verrucomicrobia bacterium LW23]